MRVADRIGVLAHGRLVQFGTAADIYQRPCSPQMACVFGHVNTVEGAVEDGALLTPLGAFSAPPALRPGRPSSACVLNTSGSKLADLVFERSSPA